MKKVLYFTFPFRSHMNVSLRIICDLMKKKIEIIVFADSEYKKEIEDAGAVFKDYEVPFPIDLNHADANLAKYGDLLVDFSYQMLRRHDTYFQNTEMDLIVHDYMCSWGRFAGQIMKIKAISVIPAYILMPEIIMEEKDLMFRLSAQSMRYANKLIKMGKKNKKIAKEFQIDTGAVGEVLLNKEYLNIVTAHRPLQGGIKYLDDSYVFVGNVNLQREEKTDGFPWELLKQRKVIYISFGTMYRLEYEKFQFFFQCFGNTDYMVVFSVGKGVSMEALGEIPKNFIIRQSVPQLEVLKHASVYISQGGFNSVHEAIFLKVPMLLIPQTYEQRYIARRCSRLSCARVWEKGRKDIEKFRQMIEELITSSTVKTYLQKISDEMNLNAGQEAAEQICKELNIPDTSV